MHQMMTCFWLPFLLVVVINYCMSVISTVSQCQWSVWWCWNIFIFLITLCWIPQICQLLLPLCNPICLINTLQELLISKVCRVLSTWKCWMLCAGMFFFFNRLCMKPIIDGNIIVSFQLSWKVVNRVPMHVILEYKSLPTKSSVTKRP